MRSGLLLVFWIGFLSPLVAAMAVEGPPNNAIIAVAPPPNHAVVVNNSFDGPPAPTTTTTTTNGGRRINQEATIPTPPQQSQKFPGDGSLKITKPRKKVNISGEKRKIQKPSYMPPIPQYAAKAGSGQQASRPNNFIAKVAKTPQNIQQHKYANKKQLLQPLQRPKINDGLRPVRDRTIGGGASVRGKKFGGKSAEKVDSRKIEENKSDDGLLMGVGAHVGGGIRNSKESKSLQYQTVNDTYPPSSPASSASPITTNPSRFAKDGGSLASKLDKEHPGQPDTKGTINMKKKKGEEKGAHSTEELSELIKDGNGDGLDGGYATAESSSSDTISSPPPQDDLPYPPTILPSALENDTPLPSSPQIYYPEILTAPLSSKKKYPPAPHTAKHYPKPTSTSSDTNTSTSYYAPNPTSTATSYMPITTSTAISPNEPDSITKMKPLPPPPPPPTGPPPGFLDEALDEPCFNKKCDNPDSNMNYQASISFGDTKKHPDALMNILHDADSAACENRSRGFGMWVWVVVGLSSAWILV